jgi:hypothetical protein
LTKVVIEVAVPHWRHSRTWWLNPEAAGRLKQLPRAHHFHYTHSALPSLFYQDSNALLGWLDRPDPRSVLVDIWANVGKRVLEDGLGEALSSDGLSVELVTRETFRGAIIRLPPALEVGETIFLLLAVPPTDASSGKTDQAAPLTSRLPPGIWGQLRRRGAPTARCFALELVQFEHEPEPTPRICEYSVMLGYVCTGYKCAKDSSEFMTEVLDRLDVG